MGHKSPRVESRRFFGERFIGLCGKGSEWEAVRGRRRGGGGGGEGGEEEGGRRREIGVYLRVGGWTRKGLS